jgi:putative ATP-dependent endonuclease of OLD family
MRIRHLEIKSFRGISELRFAPGERTVILGPNNAGKTTVLEALDLLLHSGRGRARPAPSEIDYFGRDPSKEFSIEAVIGELPEDFSTDARRYLEGWDAEHEQVIPEVDGPGIEPVVRVRVRGTKDLDLVHEFAKDEAEGARFHPAYRAQVGWVFDARTRDPAYQLSFSQGGLLDRLFPMSELDHAINDLRNALGAGAYTVNSDETVNKKLLELSKDLMELGLLLPAEQAAFEVGAVSPRELLQSLRLTLPGGGTQIPISRQGRGAQRLLLVAILLRLAQAAARPIIGGFEEPEEALEPIRQAQIARMLARLTEQGGQLFIVTHSPEIARTFCIDEFLLLDERAAGAGAKPLRKLLSEHVRQKYERKLDGPVVRALFCKVPLLVEGPGDRAVLEVFWHALSQLKDPGKEAVRPREQLGLDFVNCEGWPEFNMMARLLKEAGKIVAVWVEQDDPRILEGLRAEVNWASLLLHDPTPGCQNLEQALAQSASLDALIAALDVIATSRRYTWLQQRTCIVSSVEGIEPATRAMMNAATCLKESFEHLPEAGARSLIARLLSGPGVTPFEMKGGRQARIVAETIVAIDKAVPRLFADTLRQFDDWLKAGGVGPKEIQMKK